MKNCVRKILISLSAAFLIYGGDALSADTVHSGKHYKISVEQRSGYQIVHLDGAIPRADSLEAFDQAVKSLAHDKDIVLDLSSDGGSNAYFETMARTLRNLCPGRKLISYVRPGSACRSACLKLFWEADFRIASRSALFGFHGASLPGSSITFSRQENVDILIRWGMDQEFAEQLGRMGILDTVDMTHFSGAQLLGTRMIHELHESFGDCLIRGLLKSD